MDLYAYSQIDDDEIKKIVKANGIEVPRLRGYRLMKDEKSFSYKEIHDIIHEASVSAATKLCRANPFWSLYPEWITISYETDLICNYFLKKDKQNDLYYNDIRWDRIHGKKRKILKFAIHKAKKKVLNQYNIWNKYAGRDDILYIHARIGGNNWNYYDGPELAKQPWFIEKVDDYYDGTYCDIYAKIDVR